MSLQQGMRRRLKNPSDEACRSAACPTRLNRWQWRYTPPSLSGRGLPDWWSFLLKNGAGFWDGVGAARHAAFLLETIVPVPLRNAIATYVGAARNVPVLRTNLSFLRRTKGIRPHRARADRSWRHRLDGRARIPRNARRPYWRPEQKLAPVPVGDEGFSVTARQEIVPEAHPDLCTLSRQYPLGIPMNLPRRLNFSNGPRLPTLLSSKMTMTANFAIATVRLPLCRAWM